MAKQTTISFRDFMDGSYKNPLRKSEKPKNGADAVKKVLVATGASLILILPKAALAATAEATFGNVHEAVMHAFDAGAVLIIIFSGACWSLGHRTKALEILIGVCVGYIIARHAVDIRDFLKGI